MHKFSGMRKIEIIKIEENTLQNRRINNELNNFKYHKYDESFIYSPFCSPFRSMYFLRDWITKCFSRKRFLAISQHKQL